MISLIWPSTSSYEPKDPVTLTAEEIEDYDFSDIADQIYSILLVLELCNLISEIPYESSADVYDVIQNTIEDIDFDLDEMQISEYKYIRVQFKDGMLEIEAFVGV